MENMSESDESFHSTVDRLNGSEETGECDENDDQDQDGNCTLTGAGTITPESVLNLLQCDMNQNNNLDQSLTDDSEVSVIYVENHRERGATAGKKDKKTDSRGGSGKSCKGLTKLSDKSSRKASSDHTGMTVKNVAEDAAAISFLNSFGDMEMPSSQEENGATGSYQDQSHPKTRFIAAKKSAKSNGMMNGPTQGASGVLNHEQPVPDIELIYRRLDLQFGQLKELTEMIKESNKRIEKLERRGNDLSEDAEDDASTLCDMDNLNGFPTLNPKLNVRNEPPTQLNKTQTAAIDESNSGQSVKSTRRNLIPSSRNCSNTSTSHASNFSDGISHGLMLNNQVPPGARTNNFVDNFRSNTHQNMLSSPKSNATVESQRHINDISSQDSLDALRNENPLGGNTKSGIWDTPSDSKKWGNCLVQNVGGKKRNKDQQGLSFNKFQPINGNSSGTRRSDTSGRSRSPLDVYRSPLEAELPFLERESCAPLGPEVFMQYSRWNIQPETWDHLHKFLLLNEGRHSFLSSLFRKLCELRSENDREQALSALSFVNWDADHGRARSAQPQPDTRSQLARNMNNFSSRRSEESDMSPDWAEIHKRNLYRNVLAMDDSGSNFFVGGQTTENSYPQPSRFVSPMPDSGTTDNKNAWIPHEGGYGNGVNLHEINQNRNCRPSAQTFRNERIVPTNYGPSQLPNTHSNGFHDAQQNYPFNSSVRGRDTSNHLVLQAPPRPYAVASRSNLPVDVTNFNNGRQNFGFSSDAYLNNSRQCPQSKLDLGSARPVSSFGIALLNSMKRNKENQSRIRESQSQSDLVDQSNEASGFIDSVPHHYNGNEDQEDEWGE